MNIFCYKAIFLFAMLLTIVSMTPNLYVKCIISHKNKFKFFLIFQFFRSNTSLLYKINLFFRISYSLED